MPRLPRLSCGPAFLAVLVAMGVLPLLGALPEARAAGPVTNEVLVVAAVRQGSSVIHQDGMDLVANTVNGPVRDYWAEQSNGAIELRATAWPAYITTAGDCSDIQGVYAEVASAVGFQP